MVRSYTAFVSTWAVITLNILLLPFIGVTRHGRGRGFIPYHSVGRHVWAGRLEEVGECALEAAERNSLDPADPTSRNPVIGGGTR